MVDSAASNLEFEPGPILLIGAPGVGKGTQAKELMSRWNIPQISTGDLLRANIAAGTALGVEAKQLVDSGILVPDELVNRMVQDRLKAPDTRQGYILDGFPRTIAQADWLDSQLEASNNNLPLVAIAICVPYTNLLRRITGRRICLVCGSIYNAYLKPPLQSDRCDLDGFELTRRGDDSEAVFEDRMSTYERLTAPVVNHYDQLSRLTVVDGEGSAFEVSERIIAALSRARLVKVQSGLQV